jgi:hypothetical protein
MPMKPLLSLFLNLWFYTFLLSQVAVFERTYEELDYGQTTQDLIITSDGGYAFVGCQDTGFGENQLFLAKTDSLGEAQWAQFNGEYTFSEVWSLKQTLDGEYIMAGLSDVKNDPIQGDAYIIRTDAEDNMIWSELFGYEKGDYVISIVPLLDTTFNIAGGTRSSSKMKEVFVNLFKIDDEGNLLLEKTFVEGNESAVLTEADDVVLTGVKIFLERITNPMKYVPALKEILCGQKHLDEMAEQSFSFI